MDAKKRKREWREARKKQKFLEQQARLEHVLELKL